MLLPEAKTKESEHDFLLASPPPCRPASQSDSHGWSVKQSHCPAPIGIGAFEERTISESPSLTGPIYPLRSCCRTTAKSGLVTLFDSDPWRPHEACHCQRQHQRLTSASQQRLIRDASHAALITPDYPQCTPIASTLAFLLIALDLHGCTKQPRLLFFFVSLSSPFLSVLFLFFYFFVCCRAIIKMRRVPIRSSGDPQGSKESMRETYRGRFGWGVGAGDGGSSSGVSRMVLTTSRGLGGSWTDGGLVKFSSGRGQGKDEDCTAATTATSVPGQLSCWLTHLLASN